MRRLIGSVLIGALLMVACSAVIGGGRAHAQAPVERGCIVFEDDSFLCGTIIDDDGPWIDFNSPYVEGCIPGGLCEDTGWDYPPVEDS